MTILLHNIIILTITHLSTLNQHRYCEGGYFTGYFKRNKRHGEGTFCSSTGTFWTGTYHEGRKHGQGVMMYANGTTLTGNWLDGHMERGGVYDWAEGSGGAKYS